MGKGFATGLATCFSVLLGMSAVAVLPAAAGNGVPIPTGACCHPDGSCTEGTFEDCSESNYQGNATECAFVECTQPTTTTIPLNVGACCLLAGGCMELTQLNCTGVGAYQGDGTDCNEVLCLIPTTTTTTLDSTTTTQLPATTTTTLAPVAICGDANGDLDVTAADALAALKTAVGTSMCPLVRCDYNGSGDVTAPDALLILKVAVGQVIVPMCPVLL